MTAGASRWFTLHLVLQATPPDRAANQVLEELDCKNIRLGCTPVVNLFAQHGEPIRVTHRSVTYPVIADGRRAFAYEVHSIDSVHRIRQTPQGELIQEFRPFYSLHHGEDPERAGQYWVARRDEDVARQSPGYETEVSFVDLEFNPTLPQTDVVSVELTCSNRDLPSQLACGIAGGDLSIEGGTPARAISLLRKPSRPLRFRHGRGAQWRLISHLSLNQLSLTGSGLPALKEMLRLYDISGSSVSSRQIDGIVGIEQYPVTTWLSGKHFASVVRGLEVRLTISEKPFRRDRRGRVRACARPLLRPLRPRQQLYPAGAHFQRHRGGTRPMLTAKRRIDPGIALQLLAEPHRFQFFSRRCGFWSGCSSARGQGRSGPCPHAYVFTTRCRWRFRRPSWTPSARPIRRDGERLESDAALAFAIETESLGEVHLTPNFMGLLGTSGALPLHYTETLHERELYQRDRTPRAFLDMFSNRAVALHYAAWKKHRLALQYELDRRERFLPLVLSLLGMGMPGLRDRMVDGGGDVFDQAVAYYAGAIRQRPISAKLLQRVLADYFKVPVELEQFVGAWYKVPAQQATRLGQANATSGPVRWPATGCGSATCACACASVRCSVRLSTSSCPEAAPRRPCRNG